MRVSPRICIVGGGFGGLYTALYLQRYRHLRQAEITLIEPRDRFLFTPMMYELITDELKHWEIAPRYHQLLHRTNIRWRQTQAVAVDLAAREVQLATDHSVRYDYLVMATGAESRPVPIPGVDDHALTFRTHEDIRRLQQKLAQLRQQAAAHGPVQVYVIGGGPSGVELACKLADYFGVEAQISLVERSSLILTPFAKGLRRLARRALSRRRVNLMTETGVSRVDADGVWLLQSEEPRRFESDLTVWAVGTQPRPWLGSSSVETNERGQRHTRRTLQLVSDDRVYVLGDAADVRGPKGQPAPDTAQAAFQAASQVAANLAAVTRDRAPKPFNYLHLGDMITLGVNEAGLWSFGLTIGGPLAAICRRGVYIFRMPTRHHQIKVGRRALAEALRALLPPWGRPRSSVPPPSNG